MNLLIFTLERLDQWQFWSQISWADEYWSHQPIYRYCFAFIRINLLENFFAKLSLVASFSQVWLFKSWSWTWSGFRLYSYLTEQTISITSLINEFGVKPEVQVFDISRSSWLKSTIPELPWSMQWFQLVFNNWKPDHKPRESNATICRKALCAKISVRKSSGSCEYLSRIKHRLVSARNSPTYFISARTRAVFPTDPTLQADSGGG